PTGAGASSCTGVGNRGATTALGRQPSGAGPSTSDGPQFDDEPVAPPVFPLRAPPNGLSQLGLGAGVHDPGPGGERPVIDPDLHGRLGSEISNPLRALPVLGHQVVAIAAAREPDLDLAWLAAATPPCRQIEVLRLGRVPLGGQIPATTMISTRYLGWASRASTVARAGVLRGSTQASQTAFISS